MDAVIKELVETLAPGQEGEARLQAFEEVAAARGQWREMLALRAALAERWGEEWTPSTRRLVALFRRIAARTPGGESRANLWGALGDWLMDSGADVAEAAGLFSRAFAEHPGGTVWLTRQRMAEVRLGRWDRVVQLMRRELAFEEDLDQRLVLLDMLAQTLASEIGDHEAASQVRDQAQKMRERRSATRSGHEASGGAPALAEGPPPVRRTSRPVVALSGVLDLGDDDDDWSLEENAPAPRAHVDVVDAPPPRRRAAAGGDPASAGEGRRGKIIRRRTTGRAAAHPGPTGAVTRDLQEDGSQVPSSAQERPSSPEVGEPPVRRSASRIDAVGAEPPHSAEAPASVATTSPGAPHGTAERPDAVATGRTATSAWVGQVVPPSRATLSSPRVSPGSGDLWSSAEGVALERSVWEGLSHGRLGREVTATTEAWKLEAAADPLRRALVGGVAALKGDAAEAERWLPTPAEVASHPLAAMVAGWVAWKGQGRLQEAEAYFRVVRLRYPSEVELWRYQVALHEGTGDDRRLMLALQSLRDALTDPRERESVALRMADIAAGSLAQPDKAIDVLRSLAESPESSSSARERLRALLRDLKRWALLRDQLRADVGRAADPVQAASLARELAELAAGPLADPALALDAWKQVAALDPTSREACEETFLWAERRRDPAAMRMACQAAMAWPPQLDERSRWQARMARVEAEEGRLEEAIAWMERSFREAGPDSQERDEDRRLLQTWWTRAGVASPTLRLARLDALAAPESTRLVALRAVLRSAIADSAARDLVDQLWTDIAAAAGADVGTLREAARHLREGRDAAGYADVLRRLVASGHASADEHREFAQVLEEEEGPTPAALRAALDAIEAAFAEGLSVKADVEHLLLVVVRAAGSSEGEALVRAVVRGFSATVWRALAAGWPSGAQGWQQAMDLLLPAAFAATQGDERRGWAARWVALGGATPDAVAEACAGDSAAPETRAGWAETALARLVGDDAVPSALFTAWLSVMAEGLPWTEERRGLLRQALRAGTAAPDLVGKVLELVAGASVAEDVAGWIFDAQQDIAALIRADARAARALAEALLAGGRYSSVLALGDSWYALRPSAEVAQAVLPAALASGSRVALPWLLRALEGESQSAMVAASWAERALSAALDVAAPVGELQAALRAYERWGEGEPALLVRGAEALAAQGARGEALAILEALLDANAEGEVLGRVAACRWRVAREERGEVEQAAFDALVAQPFGVWMPALVDEVLAFVADQEAAVQAVRVSALARKALAERSEATGRVMMRRLLRSSGVDAAQRFEMALALAERATQSGRGRNEALDALLACWPQACTDDRALALGAQLARATQRLEGLAARAEAHALGLAGDEAVRSWRFLATLLMDREERRDEVADFLAQAVAAATSAQALQDILAVAGDGFAEARRAAVEKLLAMPGVSMEATRSARRELLREDVQDPARAADALSALRAWLIEVPDDAVVCGWLVDVLERLERWEEALAATQEWQALAPGDARRVACRRRLGLLERAGRGWDEQVQAVEACLEDTPSDMGLLRERVRLLRAAGQTQPMMAALRALWDVAAGEERVEAALVLAEALVAAERAEEAAEFLLVDALSASPDPRLERRLVALASECELSAPLLDRVYGWLAERGRDADAYRVARRVADVAVELRGAAGWWGRLAQLTSGKPESLQWEARLALLEKASPGTWQALASRVRSAEPADLVWVEDVGQDPRFALDALQPFLVAFADAARGVTALDGLADAWLVLSLSLDPAHEASVETLVALRREAQRWEELAEALEVWSDIASEEQTRAQALHELALLQWRALGRAGEAASTLERALVVAPERGDLLQLRAQILMEEEDFGETLNTLRRWFVAASGEDRTQALLQLCLLQRDELADLVGALGSLLQLVSQGEADLALAVLEELVGGLSAAEWAEVPSPLGAELFDRWGQACVDRGVDRVYGRLLSAAVGEGRLPVDALEALADGSGGALDEGERQALIAQARIVSARREAPGAEEAWRLVALARRSGLLRVAAEALTEGVLASLQRGEPCQGTAEIAVRAWLEVGSPEAAWVLVQRAVAQDPGRADLLLAKVEVAWARGAPDDVYSALRQAAEVVSDTEARGALLAAAFRVGWMRPEGRERAADDGRSLLAARAHAAEAMPALGILLMEGEQWEEAIDVFRWYAEEADQPARREASWLQVAAIALEHRLDEDAGLAALQAASEVGLASVSLADALGWALQDGALARASIAALTRLTEACLAVASQRDLGEDWAARLYALVVLTASRQRGEGDVVAARRSWMAFDALAWLPTSLRLQARGALYGLAEDEDAAWMALWEAALDADGAWTELVDVLQDVVTDPLVPELRVAARLRMADVLIHQLERPERAAEVLRLVLEEAPESARARELFAWLAEMMQSPEVRRSWLLHRLREGEQPADRLAAGRELLELSAAAGAWDDLEACARAMLAIDSDERVALLELLEEARAGQRWHLASRLLLLLATTASNERERATHEIERAHLLRRHMDEPGEAMAIYAAWLEREPMDDELLAAFLQVAHRRRFWEAAAALLDRLSHDDALSTARRARFAAERAELMLGHGDAEDATRAIDLLLRIDAAGEDGGLARARVRELLSEPALADEAARSLAPTSAIRGDQEEKLAVYGLLAESAATQRESARWLVRRAQVLLSGDPASTEGMRSLLEALQYDPEDEVALEWAAEAAMHQVRTLRIAETLEALETREGLPPGVAQRLAGVASRLRRADGHRMSARLEIWRAFRESRPRDGLVRVEWLVLLDAQRLRDQWVEEVVEVLNLGLVARRDLWCLRLAEAYTDLGFGAQALPWMQGLMAGAAESQEQMGALEIAPRVASQLDSTQGGPLMEAVAQMARRVGRLDVTAAAMEVQSRWVTDTDTREALLVALADLRLHSLGDEEAAFDVYCALLPQASRPLQYLDDLRALATDVGRQLRLVSVLQEAAAGVPDQEAAFALYCVAADIADRYLEDLETAVDCWELALEGGIRDPAVESRWMEALERLDQPERIEAALVLLTSGDVDDERLLFRLRRLADLREHRLDDLMGALAARERIGGLASASAADRAELERLREECAGGESAAPGGKATTRHPEELPEAAPAGPRAEVHTGEVHTGEVHTGEVHTGEVHTGEGAEELPAQVQRWCRADAPDEVWLVRLAAAEGVDGRAALDAYEALTDVFPAWSPAWDGRERMARSLEDTAMLVRSLRERADADPSLRANKLRELAELWLDELEDPAEAVAVLRPLVVERPGEIGLRLMLGRAMALNNACDDAEDLLFEGLDVAEGPRQRAELWVGIAETRASGARDAMEVRQAYEQALSEDPKCARAKRGLQTPASRD